MNLSLQTTTGIHVGTRDVFVVQVQGTPFGPRLLKFGKAEIQIPLAAGQKTETTRQYAQVIIQAIRRAVQENNITAKKVVIALSGKDVLIRYFQIPKIPRQEWSTAIRFEAKKYIPFKIEELMWDFHVSPPKGRDTKMDVTFAAVKTETAQWYMSLLAQAGLQTQAMEPAPFGLLRLFALGQQLDKTRPVAIVDVGYGLADINIVKNRICYLTRDVTLPLEEVVFESLLNEIRMSLDYYEKLFPTEVVSKILLCGEIDLKDWDRTLMEELKVPVEKIDLGKLLKVRKVVPPVNMGVALGLSLRDIAKDVPGVNLCKSHELKAKMGEVKLESVKLTPEVQKSIKQAIAVAAVVLVGLHIFMYRNTNTERAKLDQVLMARPQVALAVSSLSYEEIESAKLQMDKKLLNLSKIIDRRIFWTEKLNELPKLLPPGVWLVELAIIDEVAQAKTLVVRGIAYHEDPVQEIGLITKLVANMRANQAFSRGLNDVTLGPMTSQDLQGMTAKRFFYLLCAKMMDSKKQQELTVFAMVLFLAAIFGYNGVYKYHKGQVDMLKGQIDSEQKKNELLQEMSILDAKLKNYKDRSFVSTEITPLIDKISTFTSESGIDIDTFNPQPLLRREDYIGIALSFPLSCTYHKFGKFMSLLESNKEFIRVESVKIQKPIIVNPQESVLPKFDITVSGYYSE